MTSLIQTARSTTLLALTAALAAACGGATGNGPARGAFRPGVHPPVSAHWECATDATLDPRAPELYPQEEPELRAMATLPPGEFQEVRALDGDFAFTVRERRLAELDTLAALLLHHGGGPLPYHVLVWGRLETDPLAAWHYLPRCDAEEAALSPEGVTALIPPLRCAQARPLARERVYMLRIVLGPPASPSPAPTRVGAHRFNPACVGAACVAPRGALEFGFGDEGAERVRVEPPTPCGSAMLVFTLR